MFDPKAYKDEWTSSQKPQVATNNTSDTNANTTATIGDIKIDDKKDDFRHFDGTKADVGGDVVDKYNGLDLEKKNEPEKSDDAIEEEIDDIIKPELPVDEPVAEPDQLGIKALSMAEPTYKEFEEEKKEVVEEEVEDKKPEVVESNDGALEDLLASKANTAINNLKSKRNDKKDQITKLNREIDAIDEKIEELNSLTEDLKDKLKQFESEVN